MEEERGGGSGGQYLDAETMSGRDASYSRCTEISILHGMSVLHSPLSTPVWTGRDPAISPSFTQSDQTLSQAVRQIMMKSLPVSLSLTQCQPVSASVKFYKLRRSSRRCNQGRL